MNPQNFVMKDLTLNKELDRIETNEKDVEFNQEKFSAHAHNEHTCKDTKEEGFFVKKENLRKVRVECI